MSDSSPDSVDPRALAEFACWFAVVLAPILTWFNGPSVSTDQAVVRTIVFVLAVVGGVWLTTLRLLRGRKNAE